MHYHYKRYLLLDFSTELNYAFMVNKLNTNHIGSSSFRNQQHLVNGGHVISNLSFFICCHRYVSINFVVIFFNDIGAL